MGDGCRMFRPLVWTCYTMKVGTHAWEDYYEVSSATARALKTNASKKYLSAQASCLVAHYVVVTYNGSLRPSLYAGCKSRGRSSLGDYEGAIYRHRSHQILGWQYEPASHSCNIMTILFGVIYLAFPSSGLSSFLWRSPSDPH